MGAPRTRRSGLGRGLEALLSPVGERGEPGVPGDVLSVVAERTGHPPVVRVVDTAGRRMSAQVGDGDDGFTRATVEAVATLFGADPARLDLVAIDVRLLGEVNVLTVLLDHRDHGALSGASVIDSGRLVAVGRATWAALRSVGTPRTADPLGASG